MDWQLLIVGLAVLAAAAYLGRRAWRTWAGKGSGCGSCSCHARAAQTAPRATLIPSEQLTLLRRDTVP